MKKKIKYTNEPMGDLKVIKDFLPRPEDLVLKEKTVKVTIDLNKSCIDFFKKYSQEIHIPYQKMIRNLLNIYVRHYMTENKLG